MPKTLKDLFLDKDYPEVPFVEKPAKSENIVNSELNGNRPLLQFGKNLPRVYGTDLVRIESRGSIDPARTIAVNSSRPTGTKGGGFGRLISNLLGQGSAYRPSDTIFAKENGAPVSKGGQPVNGDWSALKYAVDANTDYIISQSPTKQTGLNKFLNGLAKGNNPKEMAEQAVGKAIGATQDLVTKGITSVLTSNRKKVKKDTGLLKNEFDNKINSSEYIKMPAYGKDEDRRPASMSKRIELGISEFNDKINDVLNNSSLNDTELKTLISKHTKSGLTNLQFKSGDKIIVLPAALNSDVFENVSTQWNKFQYVGSPFKNYRFNDVERQIRISFKVYWLDAPQQANARYKLAALRALAFPSSTLQKIKIGSNKYAPLAFTPQIVKFSLGDYYKNMQVVVSSVQLGVPQKVSWGNTNSGFTADSGVVYPTAVDVSMDMMIIETHPQKDNIITYQMDEVIDEADWKWDEVKEEPVAQTTPPPATITPTLTQGRRGKQYRKNSGGGASQQGGFELSTAVDSGTYQPTTSPGVQQNNPYNF
jgi:hypothetical protein